jgi:hypothetical protein
VAVWLIDHGVARAPLDASRPPSRLQGGIAVTKAFEMAGAAEKDYVC